MPTFPSPATAAATTARRPSIVTGEPYEWHMLPQGLIYRSYLAGEKESRLRSFWYNERGRNLWDLTLGGNVGLIRYGTRGNVRPEGWQLGLEGAGIVRLDVDQNRDVDCDDFRGGIPITWGDSIYQVKFAYYHLSSHLGDEYLIKHPNYDRLNYSRDCFVWGHSVYPTENFRVYGEVGWAFAYDVGKPWEFQFGIDWAPGNATGSARRAVRCGERSHPRRTQLRRQRRVPGRLGVATQPRVGIVPRRHGVLQRQGRSVLVLSGQHREDRRRHLVRLLVDRLQIASLPTALPCLPIVFGRHGFFCPRVARPGRAWRSGAGSYHALSGRATRGLIGICFQRTFGQVCQLFLAGLGALLFCLRFASRPSGHVGRVGQLILANMGAFSVA